MLKRNLLLLQIFLLVLGSDAYAMLDSQTFLADDSLRYLDQIFGGALGVVGTQSSMIAPLMKFFNLGVIAFIGGGIAVSVGMSVVNTAREGTAMGRALPTVWYPLRVITGVILLAPAVSGYSIIQMIVLAVTMQGVHLANMVWDKTTDYVKKHGGITVAQLQPSSFNVDPQFNIEDYSSAVVFGQHLMSLGTCLHYNQKLYDQIREVEPGSIDARRPYIGYRQECPAGQSCPILKSPILDSNNQHLITQLVVSNPNNIYGSAYQGAQGRFISQQACAISIPQAPSCPSVINPTQCQQYQFAYNQAMSQAVQVYYQSLQPIVQGLFQQCANQACQKTPSVGVSQLVCTPDQVNCPGAAELSKSAQVFLNATQLIQQDYWAKVSREQQLKQGQAQQFAFGSGGWIPAGNFYQVLTHFYPKPDQHNAPLIFRANVLNFDANPSGDTMKNYYRYAQYLNNYFTGNSAQENQQEAFKQAALKAYHKDHATIDTNHSSSAGIDQQDETGYLTRSEDYVKDQLYISLIKMMPRICPDTPNTDLLGVCIDKKDQVDDLIRQIQNPTTAAKARRDYQTKMARVVEEQKQVEVFSQTTAWGCMWPQLVPLLPASWVGTPTSDEHCKNMVQGDDTNISHYSFKYISNPLKIIQALDLDVNNFKETPNFKVVQAVGRDIQVYIYQIGQAWLDAFLPHEPPTEMSTETSTESHFESKAQPLFQNLNVIDTISKFGKNTLIANVNFLTNVVQDVYKSQVYADLYFTTQQTKLSIAELLASGTPQGFYKAGDMAFSAAYTFPPFSLVLIPVGIAAYLAGTVGHFSALAIKAEQMTIGYQQQLFKSRTFIYIPVTLSTTMPMVLLGLMTWLFLPFLPFIVYLLTALGWFIAVIEAVIAAPLVMAGVTSPVGHEFLGRAEQSAMLLISVVIRPILIIISFITAILATYASVWLSSQLMMRVMAELMHTISQSSSGLLGGYFAILFMSYFYVYLLFQIVNQCFALVYEVPAYVMRWIGAPREETPKDAIFSIRSEAQQMFGRVADNRSMGVEAVTKM